MKRLLWPLLVAVLMCCTVSVVWAANTGKISGRVVDASTKESIPSANVLIVGTTLGGTTNLDGEYFILNVPVGTYTLRVTSLGYETQNITFVDILAGETRTVNLQLKETVLQGQEVTIVAQRDVIKRDVSTTVRSVTATEMTQLPVTTYQQALAQEAGAVGTGQNLHIRGGRPDEILYLVDGMEVKDPQFNLRSLDVSKDAIGEMAVLTAGFDAEYGEAQSAVVNLVIKEGTTAYHGSLSHNMDFEGNPYYQNYDYTDGSLSGPEPITQELLPRLGVKIPGSMSFFATGTAWGRNSNDNGVISNTDSWYKHQVTDLFGLDVRKNQSYVNTNIKLTYSPDPAYKFGLGWNQALNWVNGYNFRLSRRFPDDFTPDEVSAGMQALASGIQGLPTNNTADFYQSFGVDNDGDGRIDEEALNGVDDDGDGRVDEDVQYYSYNANDHQRTQRTRDQQYLAFFNHNVSAKTFYTIRLSGYNADRILAGENKAPNQYGEFAEPFTDLPDANGALNGHYDAGEPFVDKDGDGMYDFNNPNNSYPNVNGFHIAGDGLTGTVQQLVPDWGHFTSLTLTAKGDITSQVTPRHLVKAGLEYNYYNTASNDRPYPQITNDGNGIYTDIYRYYPSAGAAYVEDKMEFKDIIVNAGLRADYWKINGNEIQSPKTGQGYIEYVPPSRKGETYLSPRLGVAYSVTESDVFHFNYGYFYQRGRQDYYFTGINQVQTGGTPVIGNPSLKPMKTIAYELGVRHQFENDYLLDVSTYYKDIKNWLNTASENQLFFDLYHRLIVGTNAAIYYNADYASVRGFEFNVSKEYGTRLSGRFTYTIAWATGKNSYDLGSDPTRENYNAPKRETPLAWDRRHQFVFNLGYNVPLKGRPFTVQWLATGWDFNYLHQVLSGLPYSPTYGNGSTIPGQEFSKNSPWTHSADLNASRGFRLADLNWHLVLEVRNLWNAKNILGWDNNPNTLDTYLNGAPGYVNDPTSPNYGQNPKSGPNPDAWAARRLVRAGLAVEF